MPDRVTRAHLIAFLTELAVKFKAPSGVADAICPRVPVKKQSDKYRIWGKDRFVHRGTNSAKWVPGTAPNEITMRWSEDTYQADLYKLRTMLTDTERNNADDDLDLDGNAVEYVSLALEILREQRVATLFTTAGTYAASHKKAVAGGSEYDVAGVLATNQIVKDIDAIVSAIKPDAMCTSQELTVVIPDDVFDLGIKRNAAILDMIKYSERGIITVEILRSVLDVKQVLLASSLAATPAIEVEGSDVVTGYTSARIWPDSIWIGLVAGDGKNQQQPSFARSFHWKVETGGQDRQVKVYRDPDEGKEADWVEVKEAVGEKVQFPLAGGLITNCLSTR